MITIKSENFRESIGKVYDTLVGKKALARGVYLTMDGPVAMRLEKTGDCVVIEFTDGRPELTIDLPIINIDFARVDKITIYSSYAIIALSGFPDIKIVET
jgi:hypothetical protein